MAGGAKNKQKDEDAAGPSWASVKSGSELRDPKTMFQPDPHPMKVQMARQASNKGDRGMSELLGRACRIFAVCSDHVWYPVLWTPCAPTAHMTHHMTHRCSACQQPGGVATAAVAGAPVAHGRQGRPPHPELDHSSRPHAGAHHKVPVLHSQPGCTDECCRQHR